MTTKKDTFKKVESKEELLPNVKTKKPIEKAVKKAQSKKSVAKKTPKKKIVKAPKGRLGGKREGAGRPIGPWKFKSAAELAKRIEAYFQDCDPHWIWVETYEEIKDENKKPLVKNGKIQYQKLQKMERTLQKEYLVTDLCLWLHTTRETLSDYEDGTYGTDYSDTIKRAKQIIKAFAERKSFGPNAAGAIFNLKNNWEYKDRTEVEESGTTKVIVETRKHGRTNSN